MFLINQLGKQLNTNVCMKSADYKRKNLFEFLVQAMIIASEQLHGVHVHVKSMLTFYRSCIIFMVN